MNIISETREVEIQVDSPFANDKLGRKESADALTQFVVSSMGPMVICIDAPWGEGKTTFLRMWEQDLKNQGIPALYFNAWENDFSDEALISLIGEIGSSIKVLSRLGDKTKAVEYYDNAKKFGASLIKNGIPALAKLATAGALDFDNVTEQALSGLAESVAKEQIEKYENSKKTLKSFRESLSGLALSMSAEENPKPLIIIIDELDRCRPNFSIEILEKAKHFFNVPNIVFVLGADKVQLGNSMAAIYGQGLDVNGYLRRFIDFDYLLPPPDKGVFVKAIFDRFGFDKYFSGKIHSEQAYEGEQALTMFSELFELFHLTLREQTHCCSLLSLSIRTTPIDHKLYPIFLCFLIVLKVKRPQIYREFVTGSLGEDDILEHLKSMPGADNLLASNYGTALEAYLMVGRLRKLDYSGVLNKYRALAVSSASNDWERQRAESIVKLIEHFDWHGGINSLGYLVKKLEIASRFKK